MSEPKPRCRDHNYNPLDTLHVTCDRKPHLQNDLQKLQAHQQMVAMKSKMAAALEREENEFSAEENRRDPFPTNFRALVHRFPPQVS